MSRAQEGGVEEMMACPSFRAFSVTARDPSMFPSSSTSAVAGVDDRLANSDDFEFFPHITDNPPVDRRSYPVFGREKMSKVEDESSESDADILDGVPPDTYCVWRPGTKAVNKCRSLGSGRSRRWSFRDLVFGRSRSDGKERFTHLPTPIPLAPAVAEEKDKKNKGKGVGGGGGGRGMEFYGRDQDRRSTTTFLPYRRGLLGLFPTGSSSRRFF